MSKLYEKGWRHKLHDIIFEADTKAGKHFDIWLLVLIVISIIAVVLESMPELEASHGSWFNGVEWFLTVVFTLEYIARLSSVQKPLRYAFSFFGIIDLLSILPTYLSLLLPGTEYFLVIRGLRLLRVFRVLKMMHFISEGNIILKSMAASQKKISVFLFFISIMVVIVGTLMYVIEAEKNEMFSSIPQSIYWAIVTITTVGYGDISPITPLGKGIAAFIMILGYGVLAVPTGIVTSEIVKQSNTPIQLNTQICQSCFKDGHDDDANHCKYCGTKL